MCDYSMECERARKAQAGDKLVVKSFGRYTQGFADMDDPGCAVCLEPGTEIVFTAPILTWESLFDDVAVEWLDRMAKHDTRTATFTQVDLENRYVHHDALRIGAETIKLTLLCTGQIATVIQMPAEHVVPAYARAKESA